MPRPFRLKWKSLLSGKPGAHEQKDKTTPAPVPKAQKQEKQTSTQPFPFLKLPGEIRNNIYGYCLYPHQSNISVVLHTHPEDIRSSLLKPSLLYVNRQVQDEALAYLCAKKAFIVYYVRSLEALLTGIGPCGRRNLTDLTVMLVEFDGWFTGNWAQLLGELKALKKFHLHLPLLGLRGEPPNRAEVLGKIKQTVVCIPGVSFTWSTPIPHWRPTLTGVSIFPDEEELELLGPENHAFLGLP